MGWFFSAWLPPSRSLRGARRVPRRLRPVVAEGLEGRWLPSQAIQSLVALPVAGPSSNLVAGPDGALWVGVQPTATSDAIDRIGLDGSVTSFPVGQGEQPLGFMIASVAAGPDGNIWFDANVNSGANENHVVIGKVTPAGAVTTFAPIPVPAGENPTADRMIAGPDGDLWFGMTLADASLQIQDFIGRVTTDGAVTLFPVSPAGNDAASLDSLVAGPDGDLWFTEGDGPRASVVGRMTPAGAVTTFSIPGQAGGSEVATGPDGSLVLNEAAPGGRIALSRVSESGAFTPLKVPAGVARAFMNVLGPADGALWYTNEFGRIKIGRIAASGAATSLDVSRFIRGRNNDVKTMAAGSDGDLYLLDDGLGRAGMSTTLYRLSPGELAPPHLRRAGV